MQTTTERKITEIPATIVHKERDIRKRELRVAAYCRVSTDSEEQLNSYHSQITYYTTIINENPHWKLAGIFPDEGLTGTSTKKRKQFNLMMQKCRRGGIDLIITKSVSRFARNTVDCLNHVRKLKEMGVGVVFQKEGVNTLEMDDETMLTIFGALAQAESESLSRNVQMGYRASFKAGNVPFRYKGFLGYRKGDDGKPEIVPEEADIVRRVYHRYLAGQSIGQIRKDLAADGIPSPMGKETWSEGVVQSMLRNERYAGDALLQKTYISDVLTRKCKKNNGELPQYYIENNHPAIIDRDVWNKVQEEITRRNSKRKTPSKNARTGSSKYSGKFALNEILVCGECGTPYRRVTWTRSDSKKVVWRCISRLEHGSKYCEKSPTLEEVTLQSAIMSAISEAITRKELLEALLAGVEAAACSDSSAAEYQSAKSRIAELHKMTVKLVEQSALAGSDEDFFDEQVKALMEESARQQNIVRAFEAKESLDRYTGRMIDKALLMLETEPLLLSEYNDQIVRQLVDTVRVQEKDRITVILKGDMEIEQQMNL